MAVGHLGGGHRHRVRQPLRVHRDVALYSRNLLASVIAFQARRVRVRVLDALRVYDQERAAGGAPQCLAGRANLIFLKPAPAGCHLHAAHSRSQSTNALCAIWGIRLAATPEQVQHRTEHLVQLYSSGTGFSACAFQQRLDDFELFSTDVAWVDLSHLPSFS